MKPTRRVLTLVLAGVVATAAACGGDDDTTEPAGEPPAGTAAAAGPTATGATDTAADAPAESAEQTDAEKYYASVETLTGAEREAKLVADAKECGAVSVYSGSSNVEPVAEAFTEKYGVKVEVYRANSETILPRVLQERDAGFVGADVIEPDSKLGNILAAEGIFAPYRSEYTEGLVEGADHGDWIANNMYVFAVGYNTNLVDPAELPDDLSGFADEKWDGRISLEIADTDWYAAIYQYYVDQGMTEDEVVEMLNAIGANSQTGKGHTAMTELMSAGQFDILVTGYSHNIDLAASEGAPVAWRDEATGKVVGPNVTKFQGFGLVRDAKCPAGAVLWGDFALLPEGQALLQDEFRYGTVLNETSGLADLTLVPVPEHELEENSDLWQDRYDEMLRS